MPRDWNKLRLFVRENGRLHPTILFWLFFIPAFTAIVAGCYLFVDRRGDRATVAASLTRTPAPATETPEPTPTPTSSPPTLEPTATEFVYDDPSDWEFVERTDPTGKTYLDLQDWQKEQVWHAFERYWERWYRSEDGLTPYEEVEPFIAGDFAEGVRSGYESSLELGQYVYVTQPLSDISRAMILDSAEGSNVKVKIALVSDLGFPVERRDINTGGVLETDRRFPYESWTFMLGYMDGRWVIEETSVTELD